MISRHKISIFVVATLIAGSFFLGLPETGIAQLTCCQISSDTCIDNSGDGGAIPCNSSENVVPGAFCNEANNQCTVADNVPTLSEWGLISTAAILGFIGFIVIRRRKVVA